MEVCPAQNHEDDKGLDGWECTKITSWGSRYNFDFMMKVHWHYVETGGHRTKAARWYLIELKLSTDGITFASTCTSLVSVEFALGL